MGMDKCAVTIFHQACHSTCCRNADDVRCRRVAATRRHDDAIAKRMISADVMMMAGDCRHFQVRCYDMRCGSYASGDANIAVTPASLPRAHKTRHAERYHIVNYGHRCVL